MGLLDLGENHCDVQYGGDSILFTGKFSFKWLVIALLAKAILSFQHALGHIYLIG